MRPPGFILPHLRARGGQAPPATTAPTGTTAIRPPAPASSAVPLAPSASPAPVPAPLPVTTPAPAPPAASLSALSLAAAPSDSTPAAAVPLKEFYDEEFADRVDPGTLGELAVTKVNYFVITLPSEKLYVYNIDVAPTSSGREVKNRAFKKRLIEILLQQPGFSQHAQVLASDYISTLVALNDIQLPTIAKFQVDTCDFQVSVTRTHVLIRTDLRDYIKGTARHVDPQWMPALNILVRKHAEQNTVKVGADRFFSRTPETTDLRHGLNARRGFFASVRPVEGRPVLNLQGVSAAFVNSQALHLYPAAYYRATIDQMQARTFDSRFKVITKGYSVRLLYVPQLPPNINRSTILSVPNPASKVRRINGFGLSATLQTFTHTTLGSISVKDYFNKHVLSPKTPLRHPDLLVCNLGSQDKPNFVPSEPLHIVPDQLFLGQLPEGAMSQMVKVAQRTPAENVALIEGAFERGQMFDKSALERNGVKINPEMVKAEARALPMPDLMFGKGAIQKGGKGDNELRSGRVNMKNKTFSQPGKFGAHIVMEIGNSSKFPTKTTHLAMVAELKKLGVAGNREVFRITAPTHSLSDLRAAVRTLKEKPQLIHVMLPDENTTQYNSIKFWADTQDGIHTVCLASFDAFKHNGVQKQEALKFNAKAGGYYHRLSEPDLKKMEENGSTMIVGADVTHPDVGCVPHCPSIAAVVASTDRVAVNYPGHLRLQPSRQESIDGWASMIADALEVWHKNNEEQLPVNILIYRDGVSESQFAMVKNVELPKIQQGCKNAGKKLGVSDYDPNITLLVCTKRHKTRFYPDKSTQAKAKFAIGKDGNWLAGVVIDPASIRNPHHFDYYLQSHVPLAGTARPGHYFVIHNEMNLDANDVQRITLGLCATFARALTPVSQVSAAYYADLLAARGKCYLTPFNRTDHPARQAIETHLMSGLPINRYTTMQQKNELVLERIKGGWTPPGFPDMPHWVNTSDRSSPQHPDVGNVMFYI